MPRDNQSPTHCHHLYSTGSGPFTVGQPSRKSQLFRTAHIYLTGGHTVSRVFHDFTSSTTVYENGFYLQDQLWLAPRSFHRSTT